MSLLRLLHSRPRPAVAAGRWRFPLAALLLGGAAASAGTGPDLPPSSATESLRLDGASVIPAGADRYAAVWRVGSPAGPRQVVKRGVVDCQGEFLQTDTATDVTADAGPGSYTGAVVDYRTGTRSWQGHTARLTDAERAAAYDYPAPGSASARLLEAVCAERVAAWSEKPAAARRLQAELGCAAPAAAGSPPCAGDAATLATAAALELRLRQVRLACHLDDAAAARLQSAAAAPTPADCTGVIPGTGTGSGTSCAAQPQVLLTALDDDLARAAAGLPCRQTTERLAQAADGDALAAAHARFQACVARMLPKLDDRVSDADVIATGLFGACRGELPKTIAQGPRLQNGLLPELTAAVLEHRRTGRANLPTPPRRSQAQ